MGAFNEIDILLDDVVHEAVRSGGASMERRIGDSVLTVKVPAMSEPPERAIVVQFRTDDGHVVTELEGQLARTDTFAQVLRDRLDYRVELACRRLAQTDER